MFGLKNDPRVTILGKFLRKFGTDEFPRLYRVHKGDNMTLADPKPALQYEYENFEEWRKLSIKEGMACLREVSGKDRITDFDQWIKLGLEYIDNWSLWLDLKILMKVAFVLLLGRNH